MLDEKKLLAGEYEFADLKSIKKIEQETLLDAAAVLFMKQNICFRETLEGAVQRSLLVFPSLINEKHPKTSEITTTDDASYVITGGVENVYASMVVLLGYTDHFTRKHQWQNQAQYELKENQLCGFRQTSEHQGEIELTLYYWKVHSPLASLQCLKIRSILILPTVQGISSSYSDCCFPCTIFPSTTPGWLNLLIQWSHRAKFQIDDIRHT